MRLSPCVLVQPDGWARGEREGYGGPRDVLSSHSAGWKFLELSRVGCAARSRGARSSVEETRIKSREIIRAPSRAWFTRFCELMPRKQEPRAQSPTTRAPQSPTEARGFADTRAKVLSLIEKSQQNTYRRHRNPTAIASSDAVSVALKFRQVSASGSSGSSSAPSSRPASWSAAAAAAAASPRVLARNFAASRTSAAATKAKPNPRILGATSTTKAHVAQARAAVADARGTRAQALRACFEYLCGNQKFTARSC